MSPRPVLEFLTRRQCGLCDRALPTVGRWAGLLGFRLRTTDVDGDRDLLMGYGTRVPVVRTEDGRVVAEGRIRPVSLVLSLAAERVRRLFG